MAREDENPFIEPSIILALETAMRRGKLLKLIPSDINFELRFALARDTKNGRNRKVPLSRRAMQVLQALIEGQDEDDRELVRPILANQVSRVNCGAFAAFRSNVAVYRAPIR